MKSQFNESTQDLAQDAPEVVPMELLSHVAGGLPYNVSPPAVESNNVSEGTDLPYNVG